MPDFNVRSDSVDVEQIMEQIRARIREKRGVDYTEQQIRELAAVKLEKFLDPRGVRSDLLDEFRRLQPAYEPPEVPNYAFEESTLYQSHRGPLRWIRRLLQPILKLFFNPNPLIQALNIQARLNTMYAERDARREASRRALDQLYFEVMHNLVVETTRLGIEVKNLRMRVESVGGRLDFNERRARALESAVVYKTSDANRRDSDRRDTGRRDMDRRDTDRGGRPTATAARPEPVEGRAKPDATSEISTVAGGMGQQAGAAEGPGQRSRRRRRRRGRRGGAPAAAIMSETQASPSGVSGAQQSESGAEDEAAAAHEAGETHGDTAERLEQAMASESEASETSDRGLPGEGSSEPDR